MKRRHGFTLTEVLMTLSLIGTASLIATRLFVGSMKTMAAQGDAANLQSAADHAGSLLRRDVWTAVRADRVTADELDLSSGSAAQIRWTIHDGQLTRASGTVVQSWPASDVRFAKNVAGIELQDRSGKALRTFYSPAKSLGAQP